MHSPDLLPSIIRQSYQFDFEINGHRLRAGGPAGGGSEYVFLDDVLISSSCNHDLRSKHDFDIDGEHWQIEFDVLNKMNGVLACRCYRQDELHRLFVATPVQLQWIGLLFGAIVLVGLFISDVTEFSVPFWWYLLAAIVGVVINTLYARSHIRIQELEVADDQGGERDGK